MGGKPLVSFSVDYYRYPRNVNFGPPQLLTTGMSRVEIEDREGWIRVIQETSTTAFHRLVMEHIIDCSEDRLLKSLLAKHGIFAPRFFHSSVHERVARRFADASIDLQRFTDLWEDLREDEWRRHLLRHESRPGSGTIPGTVQHVNLQASEAARPQQRRPLSKPMAIDVAVGQLYQHTVARLVNEVGALRPVEKWFRRFAHPRKCRLCAGKYRVIDLPYWIYYGSNGCKDICFACPVVSAPKKEALFSLVPAFVQACGFIPASGASPIDYGFTSRLSDQQKPRVFSAYAETGGIEHVKRKFGSWFKALAETGTLPDGTQPTARGIRCLAKDGHVCHSLDEQQIDDWLSRQAIPHEREPAYPPHPELNPKGRRRADWRVGNTVIEYFGLIGDAAYEKKMEEKILLAGNLRMDLIAVYPADLAHLERKLGTLQPAGGRSMVI